MGIVERKEREKQQRREEIVLAAEKVFFRQGFKHCTMEDVADEAELSKGTLYLYFKSKDDLYLAVAQRSIGLLRDDTSKLADEGGTALEILGRIGRACVTFAREHPDQMEAIMALEEVDPEQVSMSGADVQDLVFRMSTVGTVLQVVEKGVKEKLIRNDLPAILIAHTLWMSVLSVIRFVSHKQKLLEILGVSPEKVYESHFELVLNGIRP